MVFIETTLKGAYIVEPQKLEDERGFFARTFCQRDFEAYGLASRFVQCSVSFNIKQGTLRGMHYQAVPHEEAKLVSCTKGAIYDIIVDLRAQSSTLGRWFAAELTGDNGRMLYVPEGLAHGFQTLVDKTEVFYQISEFYHPECSRGLRWNDPAVAIDWPRPPAIISKRDSEYPDYILPSSEAWQRRS